jgi:hypothetical protein
MRPVLCFSFGRLGIFQRLLDYHAEAAILVRKKS